MRKIRSLVEQINTLIENHSLTKIRKVGEKESLFTDGKKFIVLNDEDYELGYLKGQDSDFEDFWGETEEEAIEIFKDISNIGHLSHTLFENNSLEDRWGNSLKIGDQIAHITVYYNTSNWRAEKGIIINVKEDKIQVDKNGYKSWIKPINVLKIGNN